MSANRMDTRSAPTADYVDRARGGVSPWSILTGVLVAYGAMVVLVALFGSIFAATGMAEGGLPGDQLQAAAWGTLIGLFIVQFLAYMWGGYTAGRMARGTGWINGILVAVTAVVLVLILGAMVAGAVGTPPGEGINWQTFQLPLGEAGAFATGTGIGLLLAALLGGALGGELGARWHAKLETGDRSR